MPVSLGVLLIGALVAGCTSSGAGDGADGTVASSPLRGAVAGKEFVGKSATATSPFDDGKWWVEIFDGEASCTSPGASDRKVLVTPESWQAGYSAEFGLKENATFVPAAGENLIATEGRLEVLAAPTAKGETGKIRLRANYDDGNHVEGEIDVQMCPR